MTISTRPDSRIADDDPCAPPTNPVPADVQRCFSDIYSLWCLCDLTACRRAGRCTGDPSRCSHTCMPLVSDAVREGGERLFEARLDGLGFDDAMKRWPDKLRFLSAWKFRIENRRGAPRPRAKLTRGRSRARSGAGDR